MGFWQPLSKSGGRQGFGYEDIYMCAVSMVYKHYGQRATQPLQWPPALPQTLPWTPEVFNELKEVIRRLDEIDKKLGLEHCEDPKKAKWIKAIEKRLKKLEMSKK